MMRINDCLIKVDPPEIKTLQKALLYTVRGISSLSHHTGAGPHLKVCLGYGIRNPAIPTTPLHMGHQGTSSAAHFLHSHPFPTISNQISQTKV